MIKEKLSSNKTININNNKILNKTMSLAQAELNALMGMFACIGSGLLLKYALMISKQKWVENFHSTVTFLSLPLITFIITKVISNNIALSLGMVGALSIVRFRNPVKNSLELVVYFALITIGIANSVHLKWGLTLVITMSILILISHIFRNTILIGRNNLNLSFTEGEPLNSIEITTSEKVPSLESSKFLSHIFFEKDNKTFLYSLNSIEKKNIESIYNDYSSYKLTKSIRVDYV